MATPKHVILRHIRRLAKANGGKPPGRRKFTNQTGISEHQWLGVHWLNWNEAVTAAGFQPNTLCRRIEDEFVLESLAKIIRKVGRYPTKAEIRYHCVRDPELPNPWPIHRLGRKAELIALLIDFCDRRAGFEDIRAICAEHNQPCPAFVYLGKSNRLYKIGRTINLKRRQQQLSANLPSELKMIHAIQTDDPHGVEAYWHNRFKDKRVKGEWFKLNEEDVQTFCKRKFM